MDPIFGIFIAFIIGIFLLVFCRFIWWRRESLQRLNNSQIAETERGKVEYVCLGDGPVVLLLHGGCGGWDQGVLLADGLELVKHGFTVVAPSRPGYLRTPLEVGKTPEAAADAMAALLDTLNIKKVIVIGCSGGGATALQFALGHPNYVQGLVMISALSRQYEEPERTTKSFLGFIFSKYGSWLLDMGFWVINGLAQRFPGWIIKKLLKASTTENFKVREEMEHIMSHPKQVAFIQGLMRSMAPLTVRKIGLDNDLETYAHLPVYPLEHINCPTLVVHGREDGNVPFSHAEFVAGKISNAEMVVVENWGHLIWAGTKADQTQAAIIKVLIEISGK